MMKLNRSMHKKNMMQLQNGCCRIILALVVLCLLSSVEATRIATRQDVLDGTFPPNEPAIPEIMGAFTVTITARFDNIAGGSWQRLFDFGEQENANNNNIFMGQHSSTNNVVFYHYSAANGMVQFVKAIGALTEDTVDKWEAAIDITGRMTIKKNGRLLASNDNGVVPLPHQTRSSKLLGQSNWAADTDLLGAILGLKVVNHDDTTTSRLRSMELLNFPAQNYGNGFVASFYLRLDSLELGRFYQRIFDFGNGEGDSVVAFSQYDDTDHVQIEVWNTNGFSHTCDTQVTIGAPPALLQGEMALWRIKITNDGYWRIEKNGTLLASCHFPFGTPDNVFRRNMYVGDSNWAGDPKLQGVIVGLRVDVAHSS